MLHESRAKAFALVLSTALVLLGCAKPAEAQEIEPEHYAGLKYRHIGPSGNRTSAVVGVPGDPTTYYVGAASGGVWKSTDGALSWDPVFDELPAQSIGALAIAPSDANVVWAGTGEAFIRSNVSIGNGVYRSTDAGETWEHLGLEATGRIGRIVIDPRDPDIVHVAALGHCYGPQAERGVYRTADGGKTWEHVLFVDENTGCFEIAMRPDNPRILLAGMWPMELKTHGRESGGPGGGIFMSRDAGLTWKRLEKCGLPEPPLGKIGLAWAHSDPEVVYAIIETGAPNRGVLWRSNDGGENWKCVSHDRLLNERPHYASRILVNPANENVVYFAANSHSITLDGGQTTERTGWSGDSHDMWADPLLPDRIMISDDGGVVLTLDGGKSRKRIELPIAQMYHVSVDQQIPYYVYGGMQDGPAYKGPSTDSGRGEGRWESTAGQECGFIVPDPVDPNVVWGGGYQAHFFRVDYRTGHQRSVKIWPESTYGAAANDAKYRFNWTFPIAISPHDHEKVYAGSQFVHVTTDQGRSWKIISPDLTTNDESKMVPSGGLTKDNLAVEYGCTLFAIEESPIEAGCIWAGSNDGLLHVTRNGGEDWTNVSKNIRGLPTWGTISNVHASRHETGKAYVTVDFHQMNDRRPYVFKTSDHGSSWTKIVKGIPESVFSYCHWIHEDPVRPGLLFLGTENAVHVSFDDGGRWLPLQNNLPHAPVHDVVVQEHFGDLVLATYGRGFWILDDISPLRQLDERLLAHDAHLFPPRRAYRMHAMKGGPPVRTDAILNYWLKEKPEGEVRITIGDYEGGIVRQLTGSGNPGINRVSWDLRYEPASQAKLRIKPPGNPRVVEEKRFRETWEREGWYPAQSWGTGGGFRGIRVAPGRYAVSLTVDGTVYMRELVVEKDPRSSGSVEDARAQVAMQLAIREDINATTDLINRMEWVRRQLVDLQARLGENQEVADVVAAAKALDEEIRSVEDRVLQPVIREGDSKSFRYPNLLYCKLSVLGADVASLVDEAPNEQQREVHLLLRQQLAEYSSRFEELVAGSLAKFDELLRSRKLGGIAATRPPEISTDDKSSTR